MLITLSSETGAAVVVRLANGAVFGVYGGQTWLLLSSFRSDLPRPNMAR
jgi:hypothetical protein